jgi:hypothetical protein
MRFSDSIASAAQMMFRIAALKPKNGVTSAWALLQAGAIKGYLPPRFCLKTGRWRASESPVEGAADIAGTARRAGPTY